MGVLKGVLYFFALAFLLAGGGVVAAFGPNVFTVPFLLFCLTLGVLTFVQARKFNTQSAEGQKVQFEETYRQLAAKNGGVVPLSALMHATGETKEAAQTKMRELVGQGIAEIDFADSGEMQFRRTPMDEARAQLASMRQKV